MSTKPLYTTWQNNTHPSWWKDPGLKKTAYYCFVLYFAIFASGYDGSYLGGLQALDSWNNYFDTPSGNTLGLISASAYLPSFLTPPLIAWATDRFGRKPVIWFGAAGIVVGAIIGTFANGLAMLIVGRVVVGMCANFLSVAAVCLLNEIVHPRMRHISVSLFLCVWYVGSIFAAWTTFGCVYWSSNWGWRVPTLVQAAGPVFMLANMWWLPESPRWLKANGRHEEARVILERLHANGATDDELVTNEILEIDTALNLEANNATTWRSLIATPGNRKRMIVITVVALGSQWSGLGLISYYLAPVLRTVGISNSSQIAGINGGLAVWNFIVAVSGALLVERWGRRPIWLSSTAAMLVLWSIFTALNATFAKTGNSGVGAAVIAFIYLFAASYSFAWTGMSQSYTSEILPFRLRAKGMSYFAFAQSVCTCINQWVNPIALEAIEWKYYTIYIVLLAFYLVMVYMYFVETRGYTSEETAALFDGKADEVIAHTLEAPVSPGIDDKIGGKGSKAEFIENA